MSISIRFENNPTLWAFAPKPKIVDRENGIIRDVVAMHVGEALGHGIAADKRTLEIMETLGNDGGPIRGRFGHPGLSENATGKQVQQAYNFKVKGDRLTHTSHLLDSARKSPVFTQDPVEYILDMAENNPTQFGESVVINTDLVWVLDSGEERPLTDDELNEVGYNLQSPEDATNDLPAMRPVSFHYVDFVNEGALTHNGLFTTGGSVGAIANIFAPGKTPYFAQEIFTFLDNWRKAYKVDLEQLLELAPKKLNQLLAAYVAHRKLNKESYQMSDKLEETKDIQEFEQVEETGPASDEGGESLTENLAETTAIIGDVETSLSDVETAHSDAVLGAISDLQESVSDTQAILSGQVQELRDYVTQLSKALVSQARLMQIMERKLKALSGERVLERAVKRIPETDLEEIAGAGLFAFGANGGPTQAETAALVGEGEATPAQVRGRDLTQAAWGNRQRIDGGQ